MKGFHQRVHVRFFMPYLVPSQSRLVCSTHPVLCSQDRYVCRMPVIALGNEYGKLNECMARDDIDTTDIVYIEKHK